jgi:PAS domain S-box-containing protein
MSVAKFSLNNSKNPAAWIAALYLTVSVVWIIWSDRLAALDKTGTLQTRKGLFFVAATTALLYYLINRYVRAARANERRLQALSVRDIMGVVYADASGTFFGANETYLKTVECSRAELKAGILNWRAMTPPEYSNLDNIAWTQLEAEGSCKTYRKELVRRDGTRVPVLVGATVSAKNPLEIVAFFVDVTEQEFVRAEGLRLARIVETTSQPIVSFALDGTITTWNHGAEQQYGYTEVEAVGKNGRFIAPSDQPGEWDRVVNAAKAGMSDRFEVLRQTNSGEIKSMSVTVSPTFDSSGNIIGGSSIGSDLTDVKRAQLMEAQFQQAQKLESLGRLAGGVAHDFNNLLMVITSFTQLLKEEPSGGPTQQQYADEILTAADRAAGLTRQLLTFSRKQMMKPEPTDINVVITETARMLERVIGEDVKLKLVLGDSLWMVEADAAQLTQVLMNLCVNARDAMPKGGVVTLSTANVTITPGRPVVGVEPGEWVCLQAIDSGTGMNEVVKSKLFEPFFTTKEQGRGTGLGLSMVYGVVKQSGGHIRVESALGAGATFSIYLPRTTKTVAVKAPTAPVYLTGFETVLVVEDEHSLRSSITRFLERRNYRVLSAASGVEALHLVRSQRPRLDLVITDLGMPEMTGKELLSRLRGEFSQLPAVFMTGYADAWDHADDSPEIVVLAKPFALDELGRVVRMTLDNVKSVTHSEQSNS